MTRSEETLGGQQPVREYAELRLEEFGPLGDTFASFEGQHINVFGGIPGEVVVAEIVRFRRRRKRIVSAIVTDVVEPSPHRVAAPCGYFGSCTGCQWQHVDYGHQLSLKRTAVQREIDQYQSLADTAVSDTLSAPEPYGYRNHARFTVRRQGSLGYVNRINRRFVQIDECMLMAAGINEILDHLQGRSQETSQLSVRYGINTSDYLVQPTLQAYDIPVTSGQKHYTDELSGARFRIASPSFFQVNTRQAERLVELVRDRLELKGEETLVDAYAGVGTFAVLLAQDVRRVIAIEESDAAVQDASVNTEGLPNVEFLLGKTEDVLMSLDTAPDALIVDPPRAGCHPEVLDAIGRCPPSRVVYVSCDPSTLARDLDVLVESGFTAERLEPVDMFPQTYHVECIATLSGPAPGTGTGVV